MFFSFVIRKVRFTAARKLNQGRKKNKQKKSDRPYREGGPGKGTREKGNEKNLREKPVIWLCACVRNWPGEVVKGSGLVSGGKPLCVGWVSSVA